MYIELYMWLCMVPNQCPLQRCQQSGSTLTAPSHYMNQCWYLINEVLWHSLESSFTATATATFLFNKFENHIFNISATPPMRQWVQIQHLYLFHQCLHCNMHQSNNFIHSRIHCTLSVRLSSDQPVYENNSVRRYQVLCIYDIIPWCLVDNMHVQLIYGWWVSKCWGNSHSHSNMVSWS